MTKKILIVALSLFVLTACSGKKAPLVDFGSPTGGPDPVKLMPTYGPNDPVPN